MAIPVAPLTTNGKIAIIPRNKAPTNVILVKILLKKPAVFGPGRIPGTKPPVSDAGTYTFAIATAKPGTIEWISNIATVSFEFE